MPSSSAKSACGADKEWKDKMEVCRECEVLASLL